MLLFLLVTVFFSVRAFSISKLENAKPCGVEASPNLIHHNPWTVFLEYYKDGKRSYLRCGGSLISSRHVVTAAHCVKKQAFTSLKVRLGEYDLYTDRDCVDSVCSDSPVRINVANIHVPSTYDKKEDDIAVLELEKDAPYTDFIRSICLPTSKGEGDTTLTSSGWGELSGTWEHKYSHIKKVIQLPIWSEERCQQTYKHKLPQKVLCAGGEKGIDTCRGDSGGPLVLNRGSRGRMELVGVTSAGPQHCGTEGLPGIYTSVYDHLSFINEVIEKS